MSCESGRSGEKSAEEYLSARGFSLVERNYRSGRVGEIDLIVKKDDLLIFVEVKLRNSYQFGGAIYAVSEKKKRRMRQVADLFLSENPHIKKSIDSCRFDLISIQGGKIEWIEDIVR